MLENWYMMANDTGLRIRYLFISFYDTRKYRRVITETLIRLSEMQKRL